MDYSKKVKRTLREEVWKISVFQIMRLEGRGQGIWRVRKTVRLSGLVGIQNYAGGGAWSGRLECLMMTDVNTEVRPLILCKISPIPPSSECFSQTHTISFLSFFLH